MEQIYYQAKPIAVKKKFVFSKDIDHFFVDVYDVYKFIILFFRGVFSPPFDRKEVIKQCYQVGYKSVFLISLTGFLTGIVFTKQSRPSLAEFGATSWLPSLIGIAIIRALAPLITSLICAGKVGSQIGAEIGSMKVTEQIDAMEVSAANPFKFLVVTRVVATTLMIPILTLYAGFVGMLGSFINVNENEQISFTTFFQDAFTRISFLDIGGSIVKSIVMGFTIGIVGCYYGYRATRGTAGVGLAANSSVVVAMFLVFIEEILIVQVINWLRPI